MVRLEGPSLIKERSSRPSDQDPPITQHSHLISLLDSPILPTTLLTPQGLSSRFGSVCSHDPHRLPLYLVCRYCSSFIILVRRPTSSPISFNPYLSDPLTLLLLIHLSHHDVFLLFSLSHDIIVVLLILQS